MVDGVAVTIFFACALKVNYWDQTKNVLDQSGFAARVDTCPPLSSVSLQVCVCLDRYMAVVHPVIFSRVRDNRLRALLSAVVWGLVLSYGLAKSLVNTVFVRYELFSAIILFAFIIMLFSNVSIIWVLRLSVAGKEKMHPVKKKALQMVIVILAINVVNYLPAVVLMPFVSRYSFVDYHCKIRLSVYLLMDLSSSIEPLLYLTKMECGCCGQRGKDPAGPT